MFTYDEKTTEQVKSVLERLHHSGERVRVFLGNTETGEAWSEEWSVTGRIGRSFGKNKIPLLVHNARSLGGGALLDGCIVAIKSKRGWLYRHKNFDVGEWAQSGATVFHNGAVHARFKSEAKAARYVAFMKGERLAK